MCKNEAFAREQVTELELIEIDDFYLIKPLSFKFLLKQK